VVGEVVDAPADTDLSLAATGEVLPDDSVELDVTATVDGDAPESES